MGIIRSAFVIDEKGKIAGAFYKVSPKDTVPKTKAVLEAPRRSSGNARSRSRLGADGVVAAVDVDDLAGRRGEPVRQQRDHGLRRRLGVADVPAER